MFLLAGVMAILYAFRRQSGSPSVTNRKAIDIWNLEIETGEEE